MLVDAPVKCPACAQHDVVNVLSLQAHGCVTCRNCGAVFDFVTQQLINRNEESALRREVTRPRRAIG